MLDILNRYIHGYVAIPVILACQKQGLFSLLEAEDPLSLSQMVSRTHANEGHLQVACRMFESLGWLEKDEQARYRLVLSPTELDAIKAIPAALSSFVAIPVDKLFKRFRYKSQLIKCLALLHNLPMNTQTNEFIHGAILTPVLIALKKMPAVFNEADGILNLDEIPKSVRQTLLTVFIRKNWISIKNSTAWLTEAGLFMLQRAYNMAVAVSHAPMLSQMDAVLFGDAERVFAKDSKGHELHIDRSLNVIGSGFQHARYFDDVEQIVLALFDNPQFAEQPRYIIDTGCGDGAFLKKMYELIFAKSARGRVLHDYPLHMIGVDYNEKALIETEKTLSDIPYYTLHGDIADPAGIMRDLKKRGITDPENALHIRSFLDHDRPYVPPANKLQAELRSYDVTQGVFVNRQGGVISAPEMMQSLVEHLKRWGDIITRHGLLILEVHALRPATVRKFFSENESFHFDALQAFTSQYLVEAQVFLLAAAEAGLFPKLSFAKRYPQTLPYSRITLSYFEKRPFTLETAKLSDLPALMRLEAECWEPALCASSDEICQRLALYPAGQFVVKMNERIVGVLYTQRVSDVEKVKHSTYHQLSTLHSGDGAHLQLICINVAKDMQDNGLGDQLREFVLWWATLQGGIDNIIGVTRCKNYKEHASLSLDAYLAKHNASKEGLDPILRFHTSHGAKIKGIVPNFRPKDSDNKGAGVLIEYALSPQSESQAITATPTSVTDVLGTVNRCIHHLLPEKFSSHYMPTAALRDLGFDSLRLLELRTLLNQTFQIKLEPTFFFQYSTPAAIATYLKKQNRFNVEPIVRAEAADSTDEMTSTDTAEEGIAVIGMSCRFPGDVKDPDAFWELLQSGRSAITKVPASRLGYLQESLTYGGFITDIDYFDADYFHIAPREAKLMDPQQRLLLEVAASALEHAGVPADLLQHSKTGVFIGLFSHDYESLLAKQSVQYDAYFATGNSASVAAGRLSYVFGLEGPALVVDTACSSSLVALHLASKSLMQGECRMAIVGSANLILAPELNHAFRNAGMLSPDGLCKTFDATANGYVRGEACVVLVLKTLKQAVVDNDTVLAVIRGTAVNQDGASNGLTAPNVSAQEKLLLAALADAGVQPAEVSYIEAHGTGTALGDPVEVKALCDVYGERQTPLILGSVKTNIGHTEASAGLAGLMKVILMMQHKQIAPHLHFTQWNPHIHLGQAPIQVVTGLQPWHASNGRRIAGVSSFGFSGTNAHVIVEEAPRLSHASVTNRHVVLLTLSAKTDVALQQRLRDLSQWLSANTEYLTTQAITVQEIGYTLNHGRTHFEKRIAILATQLSDLRDTLQIVLQGKLSSNVLQQPTEKHAAIEVETLEAKVRSLHLASDEVYRETLTQLAHYYILGLNWDWRVFYAGTHLRRIPLPTYPFAKEVYWFDEVKQQSPVVNLTPKPVKSVPLAMKAGLVALEIEADGVAIVRMLDRAGKNQFSYALLQALEAVFQEIAASELIKVVVITGFDDVFCLGGDREVLLAITKGEVTYTDLPFMYRGLLDCPYPVIAAMQGHAFGAGLAFGLYADITVLGEESLYTANFMKYGFTPGVGSTFILKEKLSYPLAFEMMWSAKEYTGSELKARGAPLLFRTNAEVMSEAMQIARSLARKPRYTLMIFKREMSTSMHEHLTPTIARELQMHKAIFTDTDAAVNIQKHFQQVSQFNEVAIAQSAIPAAPLKVQQEVKPVEAQLPSVTAIQSGVLQYVAETVANKLQIPQEKMDHQRSFRELGVDSITAVEIVRELGRHYKLSLEAATIYDYPNVKQLTGYLTQELQRLSPVSHIVQVPQVEVATLVMETPKIRLSGTQAAAAAIPSVIMSVAKPLTLKTKNAEPKAVPSTAVEPIKAATTDIAIIAYTGRFPDANDVETFWDNLTQGHDSIKEVPSTRWDAKTFYSPDPEAINKTYSKWGGFVQPIAEFDPLFFGISPAEAEQMDPQQRLFLEESWKLFELAGLTPERLAGMRCGVFVGVNAGDYAQRVKDAGMETGAQLLLGSNCSVLSSRISYLLDLKGPSIAIDTACSSSLVAVHQACQSIWSGESEMALAGGVYILTTPEMHIMTSKAGMLSPDGLCKTFDNAADGFVPGEAVGMILLKPLHKAIADRDVIHAVLKGSGVNQDGKTNGLTAPSAKSQTDLIRSVYQRFQIDARRISYVEAHGTGTKLGDPIEVSALTRAFREASEAKQYCAIGSVKTNMGHSLLAAGIVSVIKVLLCLKHQKLVPSLHFDEANEHIQFAESPFYVNTEYKNWDSTTPRLTAVSSFGLSGTNAHVVIEEAPSIPHASPVNQPKYLVTLSARTAAQLQSRIQDLQSYLKRESASVTLADVSYTLNARRHHFDFRAVMMVTSLVDLQTRLEKIIQGVTVEHYWHSALALNPPAVSEQQLMSELLLANAVRYPEILGDIALHYCCGHDVPWDALYDKALHHVLPMPTYPFARETYWLEPKIKALPVVVNETETISYQKIKEIIARVLKLPMDVLDLEQPLSAYGLDSIMALSLAQALHKALDVPVNPTMIFAHTHFKSFAESLLKIPVKSKVDKTDIIKNKEDIAVIGMSGIFPRADNVKALWDNLIQGVDGISQVPKERWDDATYFDEPKWGGFIRDVAGFDAAFFQISPREAELMDPQQRLFLQVAWQAIEDAGIAPDSLAGTRTGVYVGAVSNDYADLLLQHEITEASNLTGNTRTMIANRVSYLLDLKGPSIVIDTACSSSLVAIHQAVRALQNGECTYALAGGVNLLLSPTAYITASKAGMLSREGHCKTFDKDANGYVRAEGIAAVLLKPLSQALADKDPILAIIKGVAVNHGGHVSSLTVPNPNAQAEVIKAACLDANVPIASISYVETHGTGTALGDPIEINGLKQAFQELALMQKSPLQRCGLGSVKTQVGHMESAAGMASLIKVILSMQAHRLPGNLHFKSLNPFIELEAPFYVVNQTQEWRSAEASAPLRAGVSSFGFGGVNSHLILEAAPAVATIAASHPCYLMTLSAKTAVALQQKVADLLAYLNQAHSDLNMAELSWTLNQGRNHYTYRFAWVVTSLVELREALTKSVTPMVTPRLEGAVFDEVYRSTLNTLHQTQDATVYRDKLHVMADLYLKQYPLQWSELYVTQPQRLSGLPPYPFTADPFWFTPKNKISSVVMPEIKPEIVLPVANKPVINTAVDQEALLITYLQKIFAEKLKYKPEQILPEETYEVYGVESLIGLEIINRLETDFGTLSKTLLYERNQLTSLAHYLEKKFPAVVNQLFPRESAPVAFVQSVTEKQAPICEAPSSPQDEPIAIIGLSGTYPLADNLETYWDNLAAGKDCITAVPPERWNYLDYPVTIGGENKYCNHGGFIPDVDKFDPLFFNIAPKEAALLDPQERLFLQTAWHCFEDAGYTRERIKRKTQNQVGVFVGVTYNFYPLFIAEEWQKGNRIPLDIQLFSIANRVSYFLNLLGPSFIIDTACSSSSAAIHQACESIRQGKCAMALAGGVNLSLHPIKYHMLGSYSFLAEDGRCRSFGENGSGYVPGEGVGAVLLKPLSKAVADGDRIYGVIRSSSMNHGGKTSGYTVPNPNAQSQLIQEAIKAAAVHPRSISYIEAHGTGTSLGDPIEIRGLQEAFETQTQDKQFCAVGSVKSNIGHLESAAGISQLTKVILQMQHQQLVPSLHSAQLNPLIDFESTPFYVQQTLSEWRAAPGQPRRAGVRSFGAGGTNVHFIVEEYVAETAHVAVQAPCLFLLSALHEERLQEYKMRVATFIEKLAPQQKDAALWLQQLCYTSQIGRESFTTRAAWLVKDSADLINKLRGQLQQGEQQWFNASASMQALSDEAKAAVAARAWQTLAALWCEGVMVPWGAMYAEANPGIASYPTYPFAKRRCWIATQAPATTAVMPAAVVQAPTEVKPTTITAPVSTPTQVQVSQPEESAIDINDWLYTTEWEAAPNTNNQIEALTGCWLVIGNNKLDSVLTKAMSEARLIHAQFGSQFVEKDPAHFEFNPESTKDVQALLLTAQAQQIQGIIYVGEAIQNKLQDDLTAITTPNFAAETLFHLLQACTQVLAEQPLRLALVTYGAQMVSGHDAMNVWYHHLWAMMRIYGAECPLHRVLLLDLAQRASVNDDVKCLVHELTYLQMKENHIAYRFNQRYVLKWLRSPQATGKIVPAKAPKAALITGGLGALGGELALTLARTGTPFLLLTGTKSLPPRSEWASVTTPALKDKITLMQTLESLSVRVDYVAVDITNKAAMQTTKQTIESTWGVAITSVFHLAGVTTDNLIVKNMSSAVLQQVLAVKVQGALVLHELFKQSGLQHFVLFSSVSAMPYFGIGGLSAYAMANAFLNGLAEFRASIGLPALSIDWVAWADKGMSFQYNHSAFLAAIGMQTLPLKAGMEILLQLMSLQPTVISVCRIQWETFLKVNQDAKQLRFFGNFVTPDQIATTAGVPQKNLATAEIVQLVKTELATLLEMSLDEIDSEQPFLNYGLDSILGIHIVASLNAHFPGAVSPMDLYRYPSVAKLAEHLAKTREPVVATVPKAPVRDEKDYHQTIENLSADQLEKMLADELMDLEEA